MTDEHDRASILEELARDLAIRKARNTPSLPSTGFCYYCSEKIGMGERWCDNYCRDDWEREQELIERRGAHIED